MTAARGFGVVGRQGCGASFFVPHGEARRASLAASVPRVTANYRRRRQARRAAAYAGYSLSPARPRGGHVRSGRAAAWSYPCSSSTCCFLLNLFSSSGGAGRHRGRPLQGDLARVLSFPLCSILNSGDPSGADAPAPLEGAPSMQKLPSEDSFRRQFFPIIPDLCAVSRRPAPRSPTRARRSTALSARRWSYPPTAAAARSGRNSRRPASRCSRETPRPAARTRRKT